MLKLINFVLFLFLMLNVEAQNHHFIYFESQNNKLFTIKHENKIYTSAKKNYINLSKLTNSNIQIKLDIENEKDLRFTINLNDVDGGFILKQNTNNDWVLFDMLNFTTLVQDKFIQSIVENNQPIIIEPTTTIEATKTIEPIIENVDSTKLINTTQSSLIPTPILLDSSKISNKPVKNENAIDTIKENILHQSVQDSLITTSPFKKIRDAEMLDGIEQIYVEKNNNKIDTISIFIPFKKIISADTVKEITQPIIEEKKMASNNLDVIQLKEVDCNELATEFDYKNFIAELQRNPVIKNKLALAATILKKKCYTTSQIKKLSVLFMYDKAKLDFFKLAINSIADIRNFHFLENEIKDESIKQDFLDLLKP